MTDAVELDALWDEFHRVVNMTSQELAAWLRVGEAGEQSGPPPGAAGQPTGLHVLELLRKRRADLTDDDIRTMYEVVDIVSAEEDGENGDGGPGAGTGDARLRHRLMTLGHDPLKPAR
ncbi:DUF3140 domain-containing protein [Streptomyces sp. NPDC002580]|uniref:DUF3140 domain-containing protein n=1 Tax=Streptomyces sp. NPDC002580 TaxID=3364653 RepID=UPI0036D1FDA5